MTLREPTWWAWLVTGGLLLGGVLGSRGAFGASILFALAQFAYFAAKDDSGLPHAAQVRLSFALILAVADAAGLLWFCWVVVAGTAVRVAFGYCLLGRMLSLLPWNRREAMSLDLVRRTFLTPPSPLVSESEVSAVAPRTTGLRDEAAVSMSVFPRTTSGPRPESRIERAVGEARRRRAAIATAWRNRRSHSPAGLTDRQELDCAS